MKIVTAEKICKISDVKIASDTIFSIKGTKVSSAFTRHWHAMLYAGDR
jgi:hypothetical protein